MNLARNILNRVLSMALVGVILVFSFEIAIRYQVNYAIPWSPPSKEGISELTWIRDHFGFDNLHTIVVVRDIASYLWALDYDGGLVYFGNLLYLMTNHTDYSLLNNPDGAVRNAYLGSIQKLWSYGALRDIRNANYSIVVPMQLYAPDPIELQALTSAGPGIAIARALTDSMLVSLYNAWNLAISSKDMLTAASSFLHVRTLIDCSTYAKWSAISRSTTLSVGNQLGHAVCSLHAVSSAVAQATLYLQLNLGVPTNLSNQSYVGFYFNGTTNSKGRSALNILFSTDSGFSSFLSYSITDKGIWDGDVHGILLPLFSFGEHGNPQWSSITSIDVGVYTEAGGSYTYAFGGFVVATQRF